eukprot:4213299-Prymnesium_polylepis.1
MSHPRVLIMLTNTVCITDPVELVRDLRLEGSPCRVRILRSGTRAADAAVSVSVEAAATAGK